MPQIADFIGRENLGNAIVIMTLIAVAFVYLFYCEIHFRENKIMSDDKKVVVSRQGVGFFGILFIVLLILKVGVGETAVVEWSWWLITAPLWGPLALALSILAVILIALLVIFLVTVVVDRCRK